MSLVVIYEGQRKVVKVPSANTLVQHILSDVAQQFKVDPGKFALQHKRTVLDSAQPFRFCGLSNNAQVDLVARASSSQAQSARPCKIAFAVNGTDSSITETFDGGLSLLEVLSQLVNAGKLPVDALERSPELIYLRAKYDGSALLAGTTLASLGLSGQSARFQLRYGSLGSATAASEPPSHGGASPGPAAPSPRAEQTEARSEGGSAVFPVAGVTAVLESVDVQQPAAQQPALAVVESAPMVATPTSAVCVSPVPNPAPAPTLRPGEAMGFLVTNNFDVVSSAAVLTLAKYILNVLLFPGEEKFRRINTENKAFVTKVAAAKGSAEFLLSVGFLPVAEGGALVLPVEAGVRGAGAAEQAQRVDEGWAALRAAMSELDIPLTDRPAEASMDAATLRRQAAERAAVQVQQGQAVAFDPFRSHIVRAAPQPPREKRALQDTAAGSSTSAMDVSEESLPFPHSSSSSAKGSAVALSATETQLLELQRKRLDMEGRPEDVLRCAEVIFPASDSAKADAGKTSAASEPMEVEDGSGKGVPRSVLQKILRHSEDESAPLTTQAVRDLQRAQKERVYSRTLIKIRFPDRVCLQGYFHPRHTVGDVYEWVAQSLVDPGSAFELYTSPPRFVLSPAGSAAAGPASKSSGKATSCGTVERQDSFKEAPTLADLRLVPAALINLAWKDPDSAVTEGRDASAPGSYLTAALLASCAAEGKGDDPREGPSAAYPTGRALAPPAAPPHAEGITAHGKAAAGSARGGHKLSEDADAAPKSSKPKWFKV